MSTAVVFLVIIVPLAALLLALFLRRHLNVLFLGFGAALLILVGVAAAKDSTDRGYIAIQQQYQQDYSSDAAFNVQVQQVFPQFQGATRGDTTRVERCISCHVPNIDQIGAREAAKRLACDFFLYEPDAAHMAKEFGIKSSPGSGGPDGCVSQHPTVIDSNYYAQFGPGAVAGSQKVAPGATSAATNGFQPYANEPATAGGYLPYNVDPSAPQNAGKTLDLGAVGCVVCHNGNRLALNQADAHQNLIVNPEYSWSQGAALYYQYCATCHGDLGQGAVGPPLNNQDRLGFYNEDYYYRCIEYGLTDFEHYGSKMPNWGSIAPDYNESEHPPAQGSVVNKQRVLSEDQINLLIQFIRHWEQYDTLP